MRLLVASLVRNECSRFWREVLASWKTFADEILVMDDQSTDSTAAVAREMGAHVRQREKSAFSWGGESVAREEFFDFAWESAIEGDYIFILDGDMTPARDPRFLMETGADAVNFFLYDLWGVDPLVYREDSFWRAHHVPRVWMLKKRKEAKPEEGWQWPRAGIHSGHFPANLYFETFAYAPPEYSILHLGYLREDLREDKYVAYAKVAQELTDFQKRHTRSILDPNPQLFRFPYDIHTLQF